MHTSILRSTQKGSNAGKYVVKVDGESQPESTLFEAKNLARAVQVVPPGHVMTQVFHSRHAHNGSHDAIEQIASLSDETPSAPPLEPAASIPGAVSLETVVAAQSDKTDPDGSQPSQAAPWLAEWLAGVGIHGQLSVAAAAALESLGVEEQADISLLGESDLVEAGVSLVSARRIMKAI